MNRLAIFIFFLTVLTTSISAQPDLDAFFDEADSFLASSIEDGKVPYSTLEQDPSELNELVRQIGEASLGESTASEKKAFYINAYNLLTINSIIQNDIPDSPTDIDGFFSEQTHQVAGRPLTLDAIEKENLLPVYNDARIHFAVVCAAKGCPKIRPFAYMPEKLGEQLNTVTEETLNDDYFIRVYTDNETVQISEIFKWYREDFVNGNGNVLEYINEYRKDKIPGSFDIEYYSYDWSLNKR